MLLPYITEANELEKVLHDSNLSIVDMCKPEDYLKNHVPGAVFLDYKNIVTESKPVMGLLPDKAQLQIVMANTGITPDTHVVAYDDEGGGKAARLLWTLATMGHKSMSLLNGGIHAWLKEGHESESGNIRPEKVEGDYIYESDEGPIATLQHVLDHLNDPAVTLLDARSAEEYNGIKKFANRAGHIPGAVNLDWLLLIDQANHLRMKPHEEIRLMLGVLDVLPEKEVIVYCQTHHRSALTYVVLKSLGYNKLKGYPGSWSEWGNRLDTPIE